MKKTRLLEIIREEISGALNEIPFIGPKSQYDLAYDEETGEIQKNILGSAIKNAVDVIKGMGVESTPEIAKIIVGKKARTSPNSPPELISALVAVDDAVTKQGGTFDVPKILQTVSKMANEPKSGIPDMSKYVSGEKTFSDKLQFPQTEKAVDRILNPKEPKEPKPTGSGKRGRPAGAAKTATRTKDDDGFDKVEYSDTSDEGPSSADISSDETAKSLSSTPEEKKEKFNMGLRFIKKFKDDKPKIDAYMKKAKEEYKLTKSMLDDLNRVAGRGVE
jgi:hypothetical protein